MSSMSPDAEEPHEAERRLEEAERTLREAWASHHACVKEHERKVVGVKDMMGRLHTAIGGLSRYAGVGAQVSTRQQATQRNEAVHFLCDVFNDFLFTAMVRNRETDMSHPPHSREQYLLGLPALNKSVRKAAECDPSLVPVPYQSMLTSAYTRHQMLFIVHCLLQDTSAHASDRMPDTAKDYDTVNLRAIADERHGSSVLSGYLSEGRLPERVAMTEVHRAQTQAVRALRSLRQEMVNGMVETFYRATSSGAILDDEARALEWTLPDGTDTRVFDQDTLSALQVEQGLDLFSMRRLALSMELISSASSFTSPINQLFLPYLNPLAQALGHLDVHALLPDASIVHRLVGVYTEGRAPAETETEVSDADLASAHPNLYRYMQFLRHSLETGAKVLYNVFPGSLPGQILTDLVQKVGSLCIEDPIRTLYDRVASVRPLNGCLLRVVVHEMARRMAIDMGRSVIHVTPFEGLARANEHTASMLRQRSGAPPLPVQTDTLKGKPAQAALPCPCPPLLLRQMSFNTDQAAWYGTQALGADEPPSLDCASGGRVTPFQPDLVPVSALFKGVFKLPPAAAAEVSVLTSTTRLLFDGMAGHVDRPSALPVPCPPSQLGVRLNGDAFLNESIVRSIVGGLADASLRLRRLAMPVDTLIPLSTKDRDLASTGASVSATHSGAGASDSGYGHGFGVALQTLVHGVVPSLTKDLQKCLALISLHALGRCWRHIHDRNTVVMRVKSDFQVRIAAHRKTSSVGDRKAKGKAPKGEDERQFSLCQPPLGFRPQPTPEGEAGSMDIADTSFFAALLQVVSDCTTGVCQLDSVLAKAMEGVPRKARSAIQTDFQA
ncbi:hypothetical protein KIPB_007294, partial [Kipferlia bialata]|eukprot:g7294.t1